MNSAGDIIYRVELSRNAERYLERLDRPTQTRIVVALRHLAIDPYVESLDCKPLAGRAGEYRLRVRKYRIIYSVEDGVLLINVIDIGPRGDVYKK
jgi:mRNA interferase RelE/StbE